MAAKKALVLGADGLPEQVQSGDTLADGGPTLPASSTDNALVRWDSTGGNSLQNSSATVSDNGCLTIAGGTITANEPALNISQTWNNAAVAFTGLKYNATNTASAAESKLLDLKVGDVPYFTIAKGGTTTLNSTGYNNTLTPWPNPTGVSGLNVRVPSYGPATSAFNLMFDGGGGGSYKGGFKVRESSATSDWTKVNLDLISTINGSCINSVTTGTDITYLREGALKFQVSYINSLNSADASAESRITTAGVDAFSFYNCDLKLLSIGNTGSVGIGVLPSTIKLHVLSTDEQSRLGYDANNYIKTTVSSNGNTAVETVGTSANYNINGRYYQKKTSKALTESTETSILEVSCTTGQQVSGRIQYHIEAGDGTDFQTLKGNIEFVANNKAATVASAFVNNETVNLCTSGTLTNVTTITNGTGKITINLNVTSSLAQTYLRCYYDAYDIITGTITPL
jgi:hypothetical protein